MRRRAFLSLPFIAMMSKLAMAAVKDGSRYVVHHLPENQSFDERYLPLNQDDDFYLPRRPDGSGLDIDKFRFIYRTYRQSGKTNMLKMYTDYSVAN